MKFTSYILLTIFVFAVILKAGTSFDKSYSQRQELFNANKRTGSTSDVSNIHARSQSFKNVRTSDASTTPASANGQISRSGSHTNLATLSNHSNQNKRYKIKSIIDKLKEELDNLIVRFDTFFKKLIDEYKKERVSVDIMKDTIGQWESVVNEPGNNKETMKQFTDLNREADTVINTIKSIMSFGKTTSNENQNPGITSKHPFNTRGPFGDQTTSGNSAGQTSINRRNSLGSTYTEPNGRNEVQHITGTQATQINELNMAEPKTYEEFEHTLNNTTFIVVYAIRTGEGLCDLYYSTYNEIIANNTDVKFLKIRWKNIPEFFYKNKITGGTHFVLFNNAVFIEIIQCLDVKILVNSILNLKSVGSPTKGSNEIQQITGKQGPFGGNYAVQPIINKRGPFGDQTTTSGNYDAVQPSINGREPVVSTSSTALIGSNAVQQIAGKQEPVVSTSSTALIGSNAVQQIAGKQATNIIKLKITEELNSYEDIENAFKNNTYNVAYTIGANTEGLCNLYYSNYNKIIEKYTNVKFFKIKQNKNNVPFFYNHKIGLGTYFVLFKKQIFIKSIECLDYDTLDNYISKWITEKD